VSAPDIKKTPDLEEDEERTDSDSEGEQRSWNKFKSTLKLETFNANGGLTSDCSLLDSDLDQVGSPALTPPSSPVLRGRNIPLGLNLFPQ